MKKELGTFLFLMMSGTGDDEHVGLSCVCMCLAMCVIAGMCPSAECAADEPLRNSCEQYVLGEGFEVTCLALC